jgi:hypothetical protein
MTTKELTPQDKAINHFIPMFFYSVKEVDNEIYGCLVDWKPAWECDRDFQVVYKFKGKEAIYWIGTDDLSILRKDALQFAIAVHENRVRRFSCDLYSLNNTGKRK